MAGCLLEMHPDTVNSTTSEEDGRGMPLHLAAAGGSVDCIEMLLQYDANVEAATCDGTTPLHIAARRGQLLVAQCLLEKGARETTTDNKGWLPLHDACLEGHVDVARCLLEKRPDTVNCTTSEEDGRDTPLHLAAAGGSVDCTELLLQYGVNTEAETCDGITPMYVAALRGQMRVVQCLLENGARETTTHTIRQPYNAS